MHAGPLASASKLQATPSFCGHKWALRQHSNHWTDVPFLSMHVASWSSDAPRENESSRKPSLPVPGSKQRSDGETKQRRSDPFNNNLLIFDTYGKFSPHRSQEMRVHRSSPSQTLTSSRPGRCKKQSTTQTKRKTTPAPTPPVQITSRQWQSSKAWIPRSSPFACWERWERRREEFALPPWT